MTPQHYFDFDDTLFNFSYHLLEHMSLDDITEMPDFFVAQSRLRREYYLQHHANSDTFNIDTTIDVAKIGKDVNLYRSPLFYEATLDLLNACSPDASRHGVTILTKSIDSQRDYKDDIIDFVLNKKILSGKVKVIHVPLEGHKADYIKEPMLSLVEDRIEELEGILKVDPILLKELKSIVLVDAGWNTGQEERIDQLLKDLSDHCGNRVEGTRIFIK